MPVWLAPAAAGVSAADMSNRDIEEGTRRRWHVDEIDRGSGIAARRADSSGFVVGNLLVSGGISPVDPETGVTPDGADEQVAMVFANVRRVLAAAGDTIGDIVKCTVFVQDKAIRPVVNKYWVEMFPDEASRPARHMLRTDLQSGTRLQLEIMAVLGEG